MNEWKPTLGKWNDYENYDIKEQQWKLAIKFAYKQYEQTGACWEYKDGNAINKIPYILFVQNVLKILIDEANIHNDYTLTLCALARVEEITACSLADNNEFYIRFIIKELNEFPKKNTDDMIKYYGHVFSGCYEDTTILVLLAELLFILRYEKCPCEDWQKDIEYYSEIGKIIDEFLIDNNNQRQILLCNKIKEQLDINGNISRNRNKTTEELFVGWSD